MLKDFPKEFLLEGRLHTEFLALREYCLQRKGFVLWLRSKAHGLLPGSHLCSDQCVCFAFDKHSLVTRVVFEALGYYMYFYFPHLICVQYCISYVIVGFWSMNTSIYTWWAGIIIVFLYSFLLLRLKKEHFHFLLGFCVCFSPCEFFFLVVSGIEPSIAQSRVMSPALFYFSRETGSH